MRTEMRLKCYLVIWSLVICNRQLVIGNRQLVIGNRQLVFCIKHLQIGSCQQEKGHMHMQSVYTVYFVLTDWSVLKDWRV